MPVQPPDGASARQPPALRHWHCPQAAALHLRQWDGDAAVVYDHSTGHTHLVDALAAQLLRCMLHAGQASEATLAQALAQALAEQGDPGDQGDGHDPARTDGLVAQGLDTLLALDLARPLAAPGR